MKCKICGIETNGREYCDKCIEEAVADLCKMLDKKSDTDCTVKKNQTDSPKGSVNTYKKEFVFDSPEQENADVINEYLLNHPISSVCFGDIDSIEGRFRERWSFSMKWVEWYVKKMAIEYCLDMEKPLYVYQLEIYAFKGFARDRNLAELEKRKMNKVFHLQFEQDHPNALIENEILKPCITAEGIYYYAIYLYRTC